MFDAFKQAKLQNAYKSMKEYQPAPEKDMSLEELKRLSGNGKITGETNVTPDHATSAKKAEYMREHNIHPGDKEWFKLWFAQPHLTGEDPFSK